MNIHNDKIIIIKVGTSIIVRPDGELDYNRISSLVQNIIALESGGFAVVLVTGGAVAAGRSQRITQKGVPKSQKEQMYFCVGQPKLMNFYTEIFNRFSKHTGQLLFSREVFANRIQYFSIRDTLRNLINNNIIPIINDNDILHKEESGFSDNDHLAACLGGMLNSDKVIFLTTSDGIQRPNENNNLETIHKFSEDLSDFDKGYSLQLGPNDDLPSKISAIKLLWELGIESIICSGLEPSSLLRIIDEDNIGTKFSPSLTKKISGVRKWLCTGAVPKGIIVVSPIGAEVIRSKNQRGSLLSKGVVRLTGVFQKGDVICVCDEDERLLGYGITKYSSAEIPTLLGQEGIIVVHADYFYGTDHGYFR